jgi:hypothetical protein
MEDREFLDSIPFSCDNMKTCIVGFRFRMFPNIDLEIQCGKQEASGVRRVSGSENIICRMNRTFVTNT